MHVSSRWCVTAVLALGALSCSDPVAPPAQGAFIASVSAISPAQNGKFCPSGAAFTYDVPQIRNTKPAEVLDLDTYLHKVVDGESGANVSCTVKSSSDGFAFSGRLAAGVKVLEISGGTLAADKNGTARFVLADSEHLSTPLASPMPTCTVNAVQVKGGSMWASFKCAGVESPPSDLCQADGVFVLENCNQ